MELESKLQENTQEKMVIFGKFREQNFSLVRIFHYLLLKIIEYHGMLFNYKVTYFHKM